MAMFGLMVTGIIQAVPIHAAVATGHARVPAVPGLQAAGSTITGATTGNGAGGESINGKSHNQVPYGLRNLYGILLVRREPPGWDRQAIVKLLFHIHPLYPLAYTG